MAARAGRREQSGAARRGPVWLSCHPATGRRWLRSALAQSGLEDRAARICFLYADCDWVRAGDWVSTLARPCQSPRAAAGDVALHLSADCAAGRDFLSRLDAEPLRATHGAYSFADRDRHPLWPVAFQQTCRPLQLAVCSAGVDCGNFLRARLAIREANCCIGHYARLRGYGLGRAATLKSVVMPGMVAQITQADAHVVMQRVRHSDGHAEAKNGMRHAQCIEVAVA